MPLFKNDIPGFSLEERTVPEYWWCGDPKADPWEWRELIARSGEVVYGKFFEKKAGFVGLLVLLARQERWEWKVSGIALRGAAEVEKALYKYGLIEMIHERPFV